MNYEDYIDTIADTIAKFFTGWQIKSFFGGLAGLIILIFQIKHVQVLSIFILLVVLDLITKHAAIAYQMLIERGAKPEKISVWTKYMSISLAFEEGRIASRYLKAGLISKVATYGIATLVAVLLDYYVKLAGYPSFVVNFTWLYLAAGEALSIMENLRDGGNPTMGFLLNVITEQVQKRTGVNLQNRNKDQ